MARRLLFVTIHGFVAMLIDEFISLGRLPIFAHYFGDEFVEAEFEGGRFSPRLYWSRRAGFYYLGTVVAQTKGNPGSGRFYEWVHEFYSVVFGLRRRRLPGGSGGLASNRLCNSFSRR
jgi:hypothetical protein